MNYETASRICRNMQTRAFAALEAQRALQSQVAIVRGLICDLMDVGVKAADPIIVQARQSWIDAQDFLNRAIEQPYGIAQDITPEEYAAIDAGGLGPTVE